MANFDFSSFDAFLKSLKLGAIEGLSAFILIISMIIIAIFIFVVLIINGVKSVKEHNDSIEDKKEKEFFAEYGVSPEELRLNKKIANLRVVKKKTPTVKSRVLFTNEDNSNKVAFTSEDGSRIPTENIISNVVAENINVDNTSVEGLNDGVAQVETPDIAAGLVNNLNETSSSDLFGVEDNSASQALDIPQDVQAEPAKTDEFDMAAAFGIVPESPVVESTPEPVQDIIPEPAPEPVPEIMPEPVPEPVPEIIPEVIPEPVAEVTPEPVDNNSVAESNSEDEQSDESLPGRKKFLKKKGESWLKYEGEFNGFYYDPVDAYYYKGKPTPNIEARINEYKAFYSSKSEENAERIIPKDTQPSFVEIGTPKNKRNDIKPIVSGDEAAQYGKYVMSNIGEEYFFTLYSNQGVEVYESGNFATPEYAMQALKLFKKHLNTGVPAIVKTKGKFCYILKAKGIKYTGILYDTQDEATQALDNMKNFGHTDIITEE